MAVTITTKPNSAVYGLGAPVRFANGSNTRWMKATWKFSDWQTSEDNSARATGVKAKWTIYTSKKKNGRHTKSIDLGNSSHVTSSINLNNLAIGSKTWKRDSFYPFTKLKLKSVGVEVCTYNIKGEASVTAKQTRKFKTPKKPSISKPTFNATNGTVSATITTDAGTGYAERYDTKYVVSVYDSMTKKTTNVIDNASTSTSIPVSYDVDNYQSLDPDNDYIKVTIKAYSRGYAGKSDEVKRVYYVSYPSRVTIDNVTVSSINPTGKMTAYISANKSKAHPIDKMILEYLADVPYAYESEVVGSFTITDIVDDAECKALAFPVGDLMPSRGNYTWLRVRTWHAAENVLFRYSRYWRLDELFTPSATAVDDDIVIISVEAGNSGDTIIVQLAWNLDGEDDSTGTELSWATEEDTWKSTKDPAHYEFAWSDGEFIDGEDVYQDSARISIKGLAEGEQYFIKARRFFDGETTTYSQYSNTAMCMTGEVPESVVATCEGYIPSGESLQVYWSFSGKGTQQDWQIVSRNNSEDNAVIKSGSGSMASTQIDAERLESFAVNGIVTFNVQVSTGGDFIASDDVEVAIIDRPTLSVSATTPVTTQPFSFTATSSVVSDLVVIVSSQGATSQFPEGLLLQTSGDTIYSDVITPTWTASGNSFTTNVTLPDDLDFWDLCSYELSVVAIDRETNLKSEEAVKSFTVDWEHKAKAPKATIMPMDYSDGDTYHMAADIVLTAPTGSSETDVYDIYRMDCGKPHLIGRGFPLSYTARDEYAPFGTGEVLYYRIATRTANGDVSFSDFNYEMEGKMMRFDWADGSLELPYGLTISDSYSKSVDYRDHLDGSTDGYWRQNIRRKSNLSTSVIKLIQPNEVELARKLGRYAGAVFVRLPNGAAYEADVQISDMSAKNEAVTAIAIDATEIGLTQEFMLPTPYVIEE